MIEKIKILVLAIVMLSTSNVIICQDYIISMHGFPNRLRNASFEITKVIDGRQLKEHLGWVQKGLNNERVRANFEKPLEDEIFAFLSKGPNTGSKFQVVIKQLEISEKMGLTIEKGYCDLSVDFLFEVDSLLYKVCNSTVRTEVIGFDVSKRHSENIGNAFFKCFTELYAYNLRDVGKFDLVGSEGVVPKVPDSIRFDFPLFRDSLQDGLYVTYDELLKNLPSKKDGYRIKEYPRKALLWHETSNFVLKSTKTGNTLTKHWAFVRDGKIYIRHQGEYFQLNVDKYYASFVGYSFPKKKNEFAAALLGGMVGLGVVSGINKRQARRLKVQFDLDLTTGKIAQETLLVDGR